MEELRLAGAFTVAVLLIGVAVYLYLYRHVVIQWGPSEERLNQISPHCKNCEKRMNVCTHGIPGYDHGKSQSRYCYPNDPDPVRREMQTTHR